MRKLNIVLSTFFAIFLLVAPFAYYSLSSSYHYSKLTELGSLSTAEDSMVFNEIESYLSGDAELSQSLFTEREILHMADVKLLMDIFKYFLLLFSFVFVVLMVLESFSVDRLSMVWTVLIGACIAFIGGLFKSLVFLLAFEPIFILFHKIFFMNNLWILDSSSKLAMVFNEGFFRAVMASSLVTSLVISFLVAVVSALFLYNAHVNEKKSWGKLWRVY